MKHKITRDAVILAAVSVVLQGLSLALNICVTKALGESAVGILSLVSQFFVFVLIISNGNIFAVSSRFVSEEIGKGCGNAEKIMVYCLSLGIGLSLICCAVIFIFAGRLADGFLPSGRVAVRIMALSLPLATTGSCVKGYFHARRLILVPCVADLTEFLAKCISLLIMISLFVSKGTITIFTAVAVSIMLGEAASCIFLCFSYAGSKLPNSCESATIPSFFGFVAAVLPVVASAYVFVLLSGANEALVPITLERFSGSPETALGEYGIFEGIILPVIFFPSVILQGLSCVLVPEIARESKAGHDDNVKSIVKRSVSDGFSAAFLSAGFLLAFGSSLGAMLSDNPLVASALKIMCPVIPFIYLEIVLEGILKGLGKQNFCTLNSAAEYIIRISCVLIFVGAIGFYGIIISYFASNITCNIMRILAVYKAVGLKFSFIENIIIPAFCAGAAVQLALLLGNAVTFSGAVSLIVSGGFCLTVFFLMKRLMVNISD